MLLPHTHLTHRARLARLALVAGLLGTGCAVATPDTAHAPAPPRPEIEQPLSLSIDELAVRHGKLRIAASFDEDDESSPDVSLWLGPACERREIGQGFATRTGFAWSIGTADLARAIECNVTVRVRIDTPEATIRKARTFPVSTVLVLEDGSDATFVSRETTGSSTRLGFRTTERVTRLRVGSTLVGAESNDDDDDRNGPHVVQFEVSNDDLARAILSRRRITLHGTSFATVASVGRVGLDLADDLPPEPPVVEESRVITLE